LGVSAGWAPHLGDVAGAGVLYRGGGPGEGLAAAQLYRRTYYHLSPPITWSRHHLPLRPSCRRPAWGRRYVWRRAAWAWKDFEQAPPLCTGRRAGGRLLHHLTALHGLPHRTTSPAGGVGGPHHTTPTTTPTTLGPLHAHGTLSNLASAPSLRLPPHHSCLWGIALLPPPHALPALHARACARILRTACCAQDTSAGPPAERACSTGATGLTAVTSPLLCASASCTATSPLLQAACHLRRLCTTALFGGCCTCCSFSLPHCCHTLTHMPTLFCSAPPHLPASFFLRWGGGGGGGGGAGTYHNAPHA